MKITLAQINTTPNAFSDNVSKILVGMEKAYKDNSDVVVFPELTICGYLIQDLIYSQGFVEKNLTELYEIVNQSKKYPNLHIIVGYVDKNYSGHGRPFRNMAALIKNGHIITTYQKRLLPEYDVFWEQRYFESGKEPCIFKINDTGCSMIICEDLWFNTNTLYNKNPLDELNGVQILFSINSSPYVYNKPLFRLGMMQELAKTNDMTIVYVNQIGGNDELVFDGHSMIIEPTKIHTVINNPFNIQDSHYVASYTTCDINNWNKGNLVLNDYETLNIILLGMKDYIQKSGFKEIVIGSSGGIDSALVATLATIALGKENVHAIMLPTCNSSGGSVTDAQQLHKNLGCNEYKILIDYRPMLNTFHNEVKRDSNWNKVADENIQARLRMINIMMFSNGFNALMLSTMNKTEACCGYGTIYADGCGGYNPIGDLYKMEVYELCRVINRYYGNLIPDAIINKKPSAELAPGQFDEDALLPYPILDQICKQYIEEYVSEYEQFLSTQNTMKINRNNLSEADYYRIVRLINNAEFKRRQVAPIVKVSKIAFGIGRRIPICKGK